MSTSYGDYESLNDFLTTRSYISGYVASSADIKVASEVNAPDAVKYPHLARWASHIESFTTEERSAFSDKDIPSSLTSNAKSAVNGNAKESAVKDDDDDFDMFGSDNESDDEDAKAEKEARLKAYQEKKSKKVAVIAKSSIVLDVKPWDDETDMEEVERLVRSIELDGLVWGAAKLVPIGYGIQKLQIGCVVEDDKVGSDILEEKITEFENHVQSVDVAAFQKI